jgi:L-ascorbate metabolism protein UlaG (beta-lactamase superfamily)
LTGVAIASLVASCSTVNPYFDPALPHRGRDGFHNNYPVAREDGYWTWQWQRWRDGFPHSPANGYRFPMADVDTAYLKSNRNEASVTWIGHSSVLIQVGGLNILTDPHLSERASPFSFAGPKRRVPPGVDHAQLPHIDAVVISHNHYDHLDAATVKRLSQQPGGSPRFYVPLGLKRWFDEAGIRDAVELDWWQAREQQGVRIHCVPVQHWSKRTLTDRDQTLWSGWVIEHPSQRIFFAGDTGYSKDFADIGRRFGAFDLAALPIGGYEPRWFMAPYHVTPAEAVRIMQDLNARSALGVHWGTFELTDEPLDEPPVVLARELESARIPPERFFVLKHGETRRLTPSDATVSR